MTTRTAKVWAPVNIALVKHWGHAEDDPSYPARESVSVTLAHGAVTTVVLSPEIEGDTIEVNGARITPGDGEKARAAFELISAVRHQAGFQGYGTRVTSTLDVPMSGGMASSAAGGAALTVALLSAAGLVEPGDERTLVAWCARTRSISAVRSLRGGVVRLDMADDGLRLESVSTPLQLTVLSCQVESRPKRISSSAGHVLARTSPFWEVFRRNGTPTSAQVVRALREGDFTTAGGLIEADALAMHAVMLSSAPPVVYATDATWKVWRAVAAWRSEGLEAYCTLDAGPNPHVLTRWGDTDELQTRLAAAPWIGRIWRSEVVPLGAHLVEAPTTVPAAGQQRSPARR